MTKSKAVVILKDIRSEEIDPEDKLIAISKIVMYIGCVSLGYISG